MAITAFHDFILVADQVEKKSNSAVSAFTLSVFNSPAG